nr:unnamed protein product [uncultured bacterium]
MSLSRSAIKELKTLDPPVRRLILDALEEVSTLDDPRVRGKALTGSWGGFWRYRVGNYRIICEINDSELRILAVKVAHRSKAYKN